MDESQSIARKAADARIAAAEIMRAIDGLDDDRPVTMRAVAMRTVVGLLASLAEETARCGGADCMGRKIDGLRLWVTQDRLDVEQARGELLEIENARFRAVLAAIADQAAPAASDDWTPNVRIDGGAACRHLRALATDALARSAGVTIAQRRGEVPH